MIRQLIKFIYFIPVIFTWFCLMGKPEDLKSWSFAVSSIIIVYLLTAYFKLFPDKIKIKLSSVKYFILLMKEIYKSAYSVILIIWSKNLKISPKFEWIDSGMRDSLSRVIYANSITLTPGTVSVDIKGSKILVHALNASSIDELKSNS